MARRPEVHQFLPSLGHRDAVGNHTLRTHDALTRAGYGGGIWAEHIHPAVASRGKAFHRFPASRSARRGRSTLLYQASTGSSGMADELAQRPERRIVYYHNITPAEFFEPYDPAAAVNLARGRQELKSIVASAACVMANSEYSAREVAALGVDDVTVVPPYLPEDADVAPSESHVSRLRRSKEGFDVLFVSRIVPNKGHLHLLRVFAAILAAVDPRARLFVVGAWGPSAYMDAVFAFRERLGLERVAFTGSITAEHLAGFYQECDVFLCMSEHEGYGLPLIEAMRRDVPVVAYDAAAVGETLGGAGALVRTTDPAVVAELVGTIAGDAELRRSIIAGQRARLRALDAVDRDAAIVDAVRRTGT